MDAPNYYEHTAVPRRQRESPHYKASGLIRTVGPYAQRRVALMPQAIELARRRIYIVERAVRSTAHFERPAEQVLATEP